MRGPSEYSLTLEQIPDARVAELAFNLVWRYKFAAPGFCLLDIGPEVDSQTLRSWMVELKNRLGELCRERCGAGLVYRSMARFDQQETTKFHVDGAPEQSLLMLGYEPSRIRSRLFLADFTRAAFDLHITPQQYLQDFNPMFGEGEQRLAPYATELPEPIDGYSRILLINNSQLPFTSAQANPLGVMHKAIIVNPNASERRVVNSTMLVTEGEELSAEKQQEFVRTEKISQKNY